MIKSKQKNTTILLRLNKKERDRLKKHVQTFKRSGSYYRLDFIEIFTNTTYYLHLTFANKVKIKDAFVAYFN